MGLGLAGLGRFSEAGLLVLMSLAAGDKHGYAMLLDIRETFDVKLGPGTLYQAIERLEERGLIQGLPSDDRRHPYRLTPSGQAELQVQLANMQRFAAVGQKRLAHS